MLGRILPYGKGVSWPVAETGKLVSFTNVANEEGVEYFRGEAGPSRFVRERERERDDEMGRQQAPRFLSLGGADWV